jgi:hypothetical protein
METQTDLTANYYIEEYSQFNGWSPKTDYKSGKIRYFPNQEKAYAFKLRDLNKSSKYRLMRKLPNGFKEIVKRWNE